jgi:hypothetical protein
MLVHPEGIGSMCRRLGPTGVLAPDGIESICAHFETNVIGILRMIQCFAPIPYSDTAHGGGIWSVKGNLAQCGLDTLLQHVNGGAKPSH